MQAGAHGRGRLRLLLWAAGPGILLSAALGAAAPSRPSQAADLTVTRVQAARAAATGDTLAVRVDVENRGRRPAPSTRIGFVLSSDRRLGRGDLRLGSARVRALATERGMTRRARVALPDDLEPGTYRLTACADATGRVRERSERNNCRLSARRVAVRAPDDEPAVPRAAAGSRSPRARRRLSVTLAGAGTGLVTSDPPGIRCGEACSADFDPGTRVVLTATPAAGSAFEGWGGACTGDGRCAVTLDTVRHVTARFAQRMTFAAKPVTVPRVAFDLWEPAVVAAAPVGNDGSLIYVTGHSPGVGTRAPAFVSRDGGDSWTALPTNAPGNDPGGAEGILAADGEGRAWMLDGWGPTAPLYGFCDGGRELCDYQPDVYPHGKGVTDCPDDSKLEFLDRTWVAQGNGKVLLVNNGFQLGENAMQVGIYDPQEKPATTWNLCVASGYIPGVPGMRDSDGQIAVPQGQPPDPGIPGRLMSVYVDHPEAFLGDGSPKRVDLFRTTGTSLSCELLAANWGWADYSAAGTLFAGGSVDAEAGTLQVSAITDRARQDVVVDAGRRVTTMWLSASRVGEGALLTWSVDPECDNSHDFYAAHVRFQGGKLVVSRPSVVATGLEGIAGDYLGSTVGPKGEAYIATWTGGAGGTPSWVDSDPIANRTPLTLYKQVDGPKL